MALRPRLLAVRCCVLLTHSAPPAVVYPSGLAFYDGDRTDNLFFLKWGRPVLDPSRKGSWWTPRFLLNGTFLLKEGDGTHRAGRMFNGVKMSVALIARVLTFADLHLKRFTSSVVLRGSDVEWWLQLPTVHIKHSAYYYKYTGAMGQWPGDLTTCWSWN